jgi:hypothetical protein
MGVLDLTTGTHFAIYLWSTCDRLILLTTYFKNRPRLESLPVAVQCSASVKHSLSVQCFASVKHSLSVPDIGRVKCLLSPVNRINIYGSNTRNRDPRALCARTLHKFAISYAPMILCAYLFALETHRECVRQFTYSRNKNKNRLY